VETNIIRPSVSPYGTPILLVKKKDSAYRFCVYRKLNSNTVKTDIPSSRIDDTIDAPHGAQYFTNLDLVSGYCQIELYEESELHDCYSSYTPLLTSLGLPGNIGFT